VLGIQGIQEAFMLCSVRTKTEDAPSRIQHTSSPGSSSTRASTKEQTEFPHKDCDKTAYSWEHRSDLKVHVASHFALSTTKCPGCPSDTRGYKTTVRSNSRMHCLQKHKDGAVFRSLVSDCEAHAMWDRALRSECKGHH